MRIDQTGTVYTAQLNEMDIAIGASGYINLFTNGDFETGTNTNFTWGTAVNTDAFSGSWALQQGGTNGNKGTGRQSSLYVPVDITKTYHLKVRAKTTVRSEANSLAGGHLGYACYDENKAFIDLRMDGGYGLTTLTRDATPGDTSIYVADASGWNNESVYYYRHINVYPATHPRFSAPYEFTRIGYGDYTIVFAAGGRTNLGGGEWKVDLDPAYNSGQWPNCGYPTLAGTPVCNSRAGGSYNYALGAPNYPETWTTYAVDCPPPTYAPSSGAPFRWGTKYIKFLMLENYNIRNEVGYMATFLLDDIEFYCKSAVQPTLDQPGVAIGTDDTLYVQELIELGQTPGDSVMAYLSSDHRFTVVNEIVEE